MKASVVLLAYNHSDLTRRCLDSVLTHTRDISYELILVDNGSKDGTGKLFAQVAKARKNVKVVTLRPNRGFAGGNNAGIAAATGEHVVLLSNDTQVTEGAACSWLARLVAVAESDPRIGLVGPIGPHLSGPQDHTGDHYTTRRGLELWARFISRAHARQVVDVDRLVGFCLLLKRQAIKDVGRLDERFGIGMFEDDDISRRARQAGYRCVIARDVWVDHVGSATLLADLGSDGYNRLLAQNRATYAAKWGER